MDSTQKRRTRHMRSQRRHQRYAPILRVGRTQRTTLAEATDHSHEEDEYCRLENLNQAVHVDRSCSH